MYSVASKRIATAVVKQEARALSTVVARSTGLRAGSLVCSNVSTVSHSCGPHCTTHSCCGRISCGCKAFRTTTVRTYISGSDVSTPDNVIQALEKGNSRFIKGELMSPNRNMERVKELAGGQKPFAAFLSCADSRVPIEMIFDQGFGDLFVCRIAGNIVNTETIGSLEFGTAVLGSKVLYVLGHSACGAVNATLSGSAVPGVISSLYYRIKPACADAGGDLDKAIANNVKFQAEQLAASPVLKGLVDEGKLKIIGGVYDLKTGKVNRVL